LLIDANETIISSEIGHGVLHEALHLTFPLRKKLLKTRTKGIIASVIISSADAGAQPTLHQQPKCVAANAQLLRPA
jgi:hypothetical protein